MIHCPDCKQNQLFVIDTRLATQGKHTRRRLECANCEARFTSHEIREADLTDTNVVHFSNILEKIRAEAKIPKPFREILKPNKGKVLVRKTWFQRCKTLSPCCFGSGKDTVNY